jgi:hypothetical protein
MTRSGGRFAPLTKDICTLRSVAQPAFADKSLKTRIKKHLFTKVDFRMANQRK